MFKKSRAAETADYTFGCTIFAQTRQLALFYAIKNLPAAPLPLPLAVGSGYQGKKINQSIDWRQARA
ncbi:hypothetical protein [Tropicimonas sp. IMCC34043]|uniref:hypothetical protein n=1 Tax=Tropicimonas sp. IMCC34043 TaxID=2248760 RepID=UPI00130054C3|nr:hypothetical protein [Tropicimonas sp. IMCC34043]